jgi:hypothetical protein
MVEEQIMSNVCAEDDPDILKALDGEQLKYKERILKFNDYNWKQERIMLITPTTIINIKSKKVVRREISIKHLQGITINLQKQSEMVIHVEGEPDLRFLT